MKNYTSIFYIQACLFFILGLWIVIAEICGILFVMNTTRMKCDKNVPER